MGNDFLTSGQRKFQAPPKPSHDPEALKQVLFALWGAGMPMDEALEAVRVMGNNGVRFEKVDTP